VKTAAMEQEGVLCYFIEENLPESENEAQCKSGGIRSVKNIGPGHQ